MPPTLKRRPPEQRFLSYVNRTEGCWVWTGGTTGPPPKYGCFFDGKKYVRAHRYAYEQAFGPIPDGLFVCHHCDNRLCVRPDHLFVGTQSDNIRDMWSKGRGSTRGNQVSVARAKARSHCNRGHEFTPENTRRQADGSRLCLECVRARHRDYMRDYRSIASGGL